MKKITLRVAAAGAVAGLFATVAPLSAAFAATAPAWDTTTDGPVYLVDGTSYANLASGTQLDWNTGAGVVLSSVPAPADLGDYLWATFPAPTGAAVDYIPFISPVGSERTPSAWKMWSDPTSLDGAGAWLPSVWPGHFLGGAPASVKTPGGTFSMGIAYTDSAVVASTHVVKAYYVTINVDPITGTWTFSAPAAQVVTTNVTTTTTLAATPTAVEAGQSTLLTATVSASKAVVGNVDFYEGTTLVGSTGLSGGTATKTVTVGSTGSHSYSAKFVENTVSTGATTADKFLGSTSAAITVTATAPAVALPPNGPSENALDAVTANGATAGYDAATKTASLNNIPASNNGKTVNVFAYSNPTYLGTLAVAGGTVTENVSMLGAGVHKLVITDPTTGDVLAWASFTKSDAATQPSISKTINADVANGSTPSDGEFSLTDLSAATVNLTNPALVGGKSVVSGQLGSFKVTDLRQASKQGWDLKTDVTKFVHNSDEIANSALGITPSLVSQAGTGATAPVMGTATVSGSAIYPWNFASLSAGGFSGVTTYGAGLVFTAPAGSNAGTYTSTLTLTLISK